MGTAPKKKKKKNKNKNKDAKDEPKEETGPNPEVDGVANEKEDRKKSGENIVKPVVSKKPKEVAKKSDDKQSADKKPKTEGTDPKKQYVVKGTAQAETEKNTTIDSKKAKGGQPNAKTIDSEKQHKIRER